MNSVLARILLVATALLAVSVNGQDPNPCSSIGPCSCTTSAGTVDLSALANTDGTPAWANLKPTTTADPSTYDLNFCYGFTDGDCKDATCCQLQTTGKYICGNIDTPPTFTRNKAGRLIMTYTGAQSRATIITLVCNMTSESMVAVGEKKNDPKNYYFTLNSRCACPGECVSGISAGSVLLIIFFVGISAYIAGGVVFMYGRQKARGMDMIPNRTVWLTIPGLIKDGFYFAISPITKRGGYQSTK